MTHHQTSRQRLHATQSEQLVAPVRDARNGLAAAVACHAESQGRALAAYQARSRAEALAGKARARLAQMGVASQEAARRLAEEIRAGGGASGPGTNHDARAKADAELQQATAALELLNNDCSAAMEAVRVSALNLHNAAQQVINIEAEAIAAELTAHRWRAFELHNLLLGLSYVTKGGTEHFTPWPMAAEVLAAMNWSEPQHAGEYDPVKIASVRWTQYRDLLVSDPAAAFNAPAPNEMTVKSYAAE